MNGETEVLAHDTTIFDIIINSGSIGIFIWSMIFFLIIVGFILGICAIISSLKTKSTCMPLPIKLLPCGFVLLVILGFLGLLCCLIWTYASLGSTSRAMPQTTLFMDVAWGLYSPLFALLGAFEYALFFTIALAVLHFRHKIIINKNL